MSTLVSVLFRPRLMCAKSSSTRTCGRGRRSSALPAGRMLSGHSCSCAAATQRRFQMDGLCQGWGAPTSRSTVLVCRAEKEPQFTKINADSSAGLGNTSDEPFGPCAILLAGFSELEVETFREFMTDMGADMVKIVTCTPAMLNGSLMAALDSESPKPFTPTPEVQRTIILSGLYSGEVLEVVEEYRRSGLPEAIFAAAVPKNANAILSDLCEEVMEDHKAMMERRRAGT